MSGENTESLLKGNFSALIPPQSPDWARHRSGINVKMAAVASHGAKENMLNSEHSEFLGSKTYFKNRFDLCFTLKGGALASRRYTRLACCTFRLFSCSGLPVTVQSCPSQRKR